MDTTTKLEIQQRRCFSEQFKQAKVKELIEKRLTIHQLCQLYEVSRTSVYKWLYKYSPHHQQKTTLVVQMESEALKTQQLLQQVAELERAVGQKQLEIDFLNKLLELGFDLKKNYSARHLNGSVISGKQPNTPTP
jgi:transposase-like protein